jgi:Domain of unknown function (DUF1707)
VRCEETPVMAGEGDGIRGAAAGRGGFRASHADRDRVIDLLKAAFAHGRLTKDELDERLGQALAARTYAELAALTADLPPRLAGARLERTPTPPRRAVGWGAAALAALLLAMAAVAVALATTPGRPAAVAPVRPATVVPGQFSPFIAYAAFGWLPAGYKLLEGGTTRGSSYQVAGPPSSSTRPWYLLAYPAGGCQLTQARGLLCKAYDPFGPLALTSQAPGINGRRAYWATAYADRESPEQVLAWQYAHGSWAVLELGKTKPIDAHWRQVAVKAASHARFGVHAAPPVAFPVQLTGLPASWHLISGVRAWMPLWNGVTYQPYHHGLYASQWSVSTGPASTGPRARPFLTFTIGLAGRRGSCRIPAQVTPAQVSDWPAPVHTVVNGYRVIVARGPFGQTVCAANAGGLSVQIEERSNRPGADLASVDVAGLFGRHLQLLGTSPAHWAAQPIR